MLSFVRGAAAVVIALGAALSFEIAVAQTTSPNPGAAGAPPSTQAPVGHRQPKPSDVSPETDRQKKADEQEAAEQRRLDRVLKNICRGC